MKNKNEYEFYNKSQTEQDTIINIAIDLNDDSLDVTKLSNRQTEGIILLSANQKAEAGRDVRLRQKRSLKITQIR